MDDRLKRAVALLLAGGAVLVVIGLGIVFRDDPEPVGYRVDGLNNGLPLPEMDPPKEGLPLDLIAGSVVALGGVMLAMKGSSAAEELRTHRQPLERAGAGAMEVRSVGSDVLEAPVTVVRVVQTKGRRG